MIKTTLKDLIGFIIKPDDRQINLTIKNKINFTSILFFINCLITIIIILPVLNLIDEKLDLSNSSSTYLTLQKTFFFLVILTPFIEELVFRYFLRYNGFKTVLINKKQWLKIFPVLVYSSTICFGLLHLTNFSNTSKLFFLLSPLLILPQLLGGIIISYIRVRLNFLWGLLYHFTWNFVVMIAIPFISYLNTCTYSEKKENYSIIIKKELFFCKEKQALKVDSIDGKIIFVKANHYSAQQILDTLGRKNEHIVLDELINLNFESKNGVTKDELIIILQKELDNNY